jgi:hypothetical protein
MPITEQSVTAAVLDADWQTVTIGELAAPQR